MRSVIIYRSSFRCFLGRAVSFVGSTFPPTTKVASLLRALAINQNFELPPSSQKRTPGGTATEQGKPTNGRRGRRPDRQSFDEAGIEGLRFGSDMSRMRTESDSRSTESMVDCSLEVCSNSVGERCASS